MGRATETALMARGIHSDLARHISNDGHTLSSLKQQSDKNLKSLGLNDQQISTIKQEGRPTIPASTVSKLLFRNRRSCCICRDSKGSIIIHHIEPWEKSQDHGIKNLAVLCLTHHDEAHTKKELSKNLDKSTIKAFKKKWEQEVQELDAQIILQISDTDYARWDFINHQRIFEIARHAGIDTTKLPYFQTVKDSGLVDRFGVTESPTSWGCDDKTSFHMYSFGGCIQLYLYMKEVVEAVIGGLPINDITNCLSKSELRDTIKIGDVISIQGAHTFKHMASTAKGKGQTCRGVRRANGVEISFVFDLWEATSTSSHVDRLSGHKVATSIGHVKDVKLEDKLLKINLSVLLIGSHFKNIHTRVYGAIPPGSMVMTFQSVFDSAHDPRTR